MPKICIETRDEIRVIPVRDIIFLKASHNYTDVVYADGRTKSELIGISALEAMIADAIKRAGVPNDFVRIGRSLLINISFIELVSIKLKLITFRGIPSVTLSASKNMLIALKKILSERMQ